MRNGRPVDGVFVFLIVGTLKYFNLHILFWELSTQAEQATGKPMRLLVWRLEFFFADKVQNILTIVSDIILQRKLALRTLGSSCCIHITEWNSTEKIRLSASMQNGHVIHLCTSELSR